MTGVSSIPVAQSFIQHLDVQNVSVVDTIVTSNVGLKIVNVTEHLLTRYLQLDLIIKIRFEKKSKLNERSSINDVTQFWTIFDPLPPPPIIMRFISKALVLSSPNP